MAPRRSRKPVYHISLEYLVGRSTSNAEFKYTLHVANKYQPIFDDGMTLLELAVDYDNLGLIEHLSSVSADYDVDTRNSTGDTALIVALRTGKLDAAKILLAAGADVRLVDSSSGKSALGLATTRQDLAPHLSNNLKRSNLDAGTTAELLVAADCPLEYVLAMRDPRVSLAFLQRVRGSPTLTCHGRKLSLLPSSGQMKLWKIFVDLSSDRDAMLHRLSRMFGVLEAAYIRVLLERKMDARARAKFSVDSRVCLFGNRRVDPMELLRDSRDFDPVSARGDGRKTALHHAASAENVRLLLDAGADLDATDLRGRTALFDAKEDGARVLLERGADVQIVDESGSTVLEFARRRNSELTGFLLARLAIDRLGGVPMKGVVRDQIDGDEDCRSSFEGYCRQLEALKAREIVKEVTFHDVLTDKIERLRRVLGDEEDALARLERYEKRHDLHSLYYSIMKGKLMGVSNLHRFACRVAEFISESTGVYVDFDHLVVRKILGYLTARDIEKFVIAAV